MACDATSSAVVAAYCEARVLGKSNTLSFTSTKAIFVQQIKVGSGRDGRIVERGEMAIRFRQRDFGYVYLAQALFFHDGPDVKTQRGLLRTCRNTPPLTRFIIG